MKLTVFSRRNSQQSIIGIAMSDTEIAISTLGSSSSETTLCTRHPLPEGSIKNGKIIDPASVIETLRLLLLNLSLPKKQAILAVPATLVHSAIYSLPQPIQSTATADAAAALFAPTVLPWPTDECIYDMTVCTSHAEHPYTTISLFAAKKDVIDIYTHTLSEAGIKTIAIESDAMSQARILDLPKNEYTIALTTSETHSYLSLCRSGNVNFTFTIPFQRISSAHLLAAETERIRQYGESTFGVTIAPQKNTSTYRTEITNKLSRDANSPTSLAAIGAALRGHNITTTNDTSDEKIISLMRLPPNTILGFERLIETLHLSRVIAISIIGIYVSMSFIALVTFNKSSASIVTTPTNAAMTAEIKRLEHEFDETNTTITELSVISKLITRWTESLGIIDGALTVGISPYTINSDANNGPYQITGVASTRADLIQFRSAVTSNAHIDKPRVPLGNASLETKIPFNATLSVKQDSRTPY